MKQAIINLMSRKFLISVYALTIVTFYLDVDSITKLGFIAGIVGIYAGANALSSVTKK